MYFNFFIFILCACFIEWEYLFVPGYDIHLCQCCFWLIGFKRARTFLLLLIYVADYRQALSNDGNKCSSVQSGWLLINKIVSFSEWGSEVIA